MNNRLYITLLSFCLITALEAQTLVSHIQLGSKTKAQISAQFGIPFIQYGAKYYRVTYTTADVHGAPDTASALVVIPNDFTRVYPRLVYQHGTSSSKLDVPSYNVVQNGEGAIGLLFAGLGYIALLPDYLGLGVSDGFHPYVHAATEASVAIDLLRALPEFLPLTGAHVNAQLFVTGYSQGGHASMALHREIDTRLNGEFTVTAATHLSGPYSIGEVMRNLILSDEVYFYPAYLPNTILSYQTAYGNLYNQLSEVFREPYATKIAQFQAGTINLGQLNDQLVALLVANEGSSRPLRMLQPAIVQEVTNNPDHSFNVALRANNVYNWAPPAPTRIFYCKADDQVPYQNSLVALDSLKARGAADVAALDVKTSADHGDCVNPALTNTLFYFVGYQQIGVVLGNGEPLVAPLELQPNPVNSTLLLRNLPSRGLLHIFDLQGRLLLSKELDSSDQAIDVSHIGNGLYLVQWRSAGQMRQGKMIIQR